MINDTILFKTTMPQFMIHFFGTHWDLTESPVGPVGWRLTQALVERATASKLVASSLRKAIKDIEGMTKAHLVKGAKGVAGRRQICFGSGLEMLSCQTLSGPTLPTVQRKPC